MDLFCLGVEFTILAKYNTLPIERKVNTISRTQREIHKGPKSNLPNPHMDTRSKWMIYNKENNEDARHMFSMKATRQLNKVLAIFQIGQNGSFSLVEKTMKRLIIYATNTFLIRTLRTNNMNIDLEPYHRTGVHHHLIFRVSSTITLYRANRSILRLSSTLVILRL